MRLHDHVSSSHRAIDRRTTAWCRETRWRVRHSPDAGVTVRARRDAWRDSYTLRRRDLCRDRRPGGRGLRDHYCRTDGRRLDNRPSSGGGVATEGRLVPLELEVLELPPPPVAAQLGLASARHSTNTPSIAPNLGKLRLKVPSSN